MFRFVLSSIPEQSEKLEGEMAPAIHLLIERRENANWDHTWLTYDANICTVAYLHIFSHYVQMNRHVLHTYPQTIPCRCLFTSILIKGKCQHGSHLMSIWYVHICSMMSTYLSPWSIYIQTTYFSADNSMSTVPLHPYWLEQNRTPLTSDVLGMGTAVVYSHTHTHQMNLKIHNKCLNNSSYMHWNVWKQFTGVNTKREACETTLGACQVNICIRHLKVTQGKGIWIGHALKSVHIRGRDKKVSTCESIQTNIWGFGHVPYSCIWISELHGIRWVYLWLLY